MPGSVVSSGGRSDSSRTGPATGKKSKAMTLEDQSSNMMDALLEDSIKELVAMLRADPAKVLPALALARGESLVPKKRAEAMDEDSRPFNAAYTKMSRIPKEFARAVMIEESPQTCGDDDFVKSEKGSDGATRNAFFYAHRISAKTSWPKFCLRKDVFKSTFRQMHAFAGAELTGIQFLKTGRDVQIDWNSWGAYRLTPAGNVHKTHIKHIGTQVSVDLPEVFNISGDSSYQLLKNWDHEAAALKFGKITTSIVDMYPDTFRATLAKFLDVTETLSGFASKAEQERLQQEAGIDPESSSQAASSSCAEATSPPLPPGKKRRTVTVS